MSEEARSQQSQEAAAKNDPVSVEEQADLESKSRRSRSGQRTKAKPKQPKQPKQYIASIYPHGDSSLPPELGEEVLILQDMLDMDVWLLLQDGSSKYGDIGPSLKDEFFTARSNLEMARKKGRKIALLIDSLGGDAKSAFQLATFLRRYSGGFVAVVPRFAKSAATLLTLGADEIILGRCAELGPLDTQIYNPQRNGYIPVLDKVKALERLHASALDLVDRTVTLLALRSGKAPEEMLDRALRFAADVTRPLLEKFDADEYTRMSRYLKRGEDYATRLLEPRYVGLEELDGSDQIAQEDNEELEQVEAMTTEDVYEDYLLSKDPQARLLAQHLVGAYPDHSFAIEIEEATNLLPQVPERVEDEALLDLLDQLDVIYQVLAEQPDKRILAIGKVTESKRKR